jgi:hypothetical protein
MRIKAIVILLSVWASCAFAEDVKYFYDPRPDWGIPREATGPNTWHKAPPHSTISSILGDSLQEVKIRYYRECWKTEKDAEAYLSGLLKSQNNHVEGGVFWDQAVLVPHIECTLVFKPGAARGKLLLWDWVGCFQDEHGTWWFVAFPEYFRANHPEAKKTP